MESTAPVTKSYYDWFSVLRAILLHPTIDTLRQLLDDGNASMKRVYLMLVTVSLAMAGFTFLFSIFIASPLPDTGALYLICSAIPAALVGSLLEVGGLYIAGAILSQVGGWLGGWGSTKRLAYGLGLTVVLGYVIAIPLFLILSLFIKPYSVGFNLSSLFSLAAFVYIAFLQVQFIRAEMDLSAGKAVLTLLIPGIVLGALGLACNLMLMPSLINGSLPR